jgi:hypothetical protein
MDIDEARRHQKAARVDLLAPGIGNLADDGDAPVIDGDVAFERLAAAPVGNSAAANDQIMNHVFSSRWACRSSVRPKAALPVILEGL